MRILRPFAVLLASGLFESPTPGAEPAPKAVAAWPSGPMEVRVGFDRALDPASAISAVGSLIGFGEPEKPGVPGRPGGNRGALRVAAARLEDGGRTLVLVTDPHPREATYALDLPGVKAAGRAGPGFPLHKEYDLTGVEVTWAATGAKPAWSGWWPTFDPARAKVALAGSAGHDRLWPLLAGPGKLTLRSFVVLPAGEATVTFDAASPFEANLGTESARSVAVAGAGGHRAALKVESTGEAAEVSVTLATGEGGEPRLDLAAASAKDPTPRPLPRTAFSLPWAPPSLQPAPTVPAPAAILTGGDPVKGEAVFLGDQAKCANCHAVRGKGGAIGPDLTALAGRDRSWIYQNIIEPSASIHPDYVSYTVALKDGRISMGVVRAEGADALKVGDIDAKQTLIPRADVEEIRPSATSIMPVGLLGAIGEERTRDLLAYLTATPKR